MRTVRRLAAIAVMLSWLAPGAAAVAIGVHLLIDDHHRGAHADMAESHHHHMIVSPGHDHEGVQSRRTTTPPPAVATVAAARLSRTSTARETFPSRIVSTAAPPGALFLSHCSLLI